MKVNHSPKASTLCLCILNIKIQFRKCDYLATIKLFTSILMINILLEFGKQCHNIIIPFSTQFCTTRAQCDSWYLAATALL